MKKTVLLAFFALFLVNALGADVNACYLDGNFYSIGSCIVNTSFSGEPFFFGIVMLTIFAVFVWQTKMPMGAASIVGLLMLLGLSAAFGPFFTLLWNIMLLIIGALIVLAIIHNVRQ